MKLRFFVLLISMSGLISLTWADAPAKVAVVSMMRGQAEVIVGNKIEALSKDAWVTSGAVVKTKEKSVVKLVFIDKSQINIGPNSEMKIEQFGGGDAGVIDLVKGKIRSQVSKDYLQEQDPTKSKVFVKTPNAVMGIRGTDFMISTNGVNSSAVLFEGNVVFNSLSAEARNINTDSLERIVDQGQRIRPNEFSTVLGQMPPTVPAVLNVEQREVLHKNETFEQVESSSTDSAASVKKSVVPEGLTGTDVANKPLVDAEINQVVTSSASVDLKEPVADSKAVQDSAGYVNGNIVRPANGSFLHIDSGVVIPPAADSVFDPNTNSYIASSSSGKVDASGNYVPPQGIEISNDGVVTKIEIAPDGKEIRKPVVLAKVMNTNPVIETNVETPVNKGKNQNTAANGLASSSTQNQNPQVVNDIFNPQFNPNGAVDVSNFQQNNSGGLQPSSAATQSGLTPVTIIIKD